MNFMKAYKDIFFDLDKTIWDLDANVMFTFEELYFLFDLKRFHIESFEKFYSVYHDHNLLLWDLYRQEKITKEFLNIERFSRTLNDFGIDDLEMAKKMASEYVRLSPLQKRLLPGAIESLEYLVKKYRLHIITNGFNEVQFIKIENSGLTKYFQTITTSEEAGCKKPGAYIFKFSIDRAKADPAKSLMIGDDIDVDISGAIKAGMDQVFYNPEGITSEVKPTYEVKSLCELIEIL
jgi:putative hydrolase of the HAD superfamily